ncbi:MAG: hypothetical protein ACOYVD_16785, partial [Bacillota bacterium]
ASQAIVEDYTYNLSTTPIKPNTYGNPSAFYSGKDFGHTLVTAERGKNLEIFVMNVLHHLQSL